MQLVLHSVLPREQEPIPLSFGAIATGAESDLLQSPAVRVRTCWPGVDAPAWLLPMPNQTFALDSYTRADIRCPTEIRTASLKRQAHFFFGRLAAKLALLDIGRSPVEVPIGIGRQPMWPDGLVGSITHCDSHAAALVLPSALYGGVGIDLENITTAADRTSIEHLVFGQEEQSRLLFLGRTIPAHVLFLLGFSAKESLFKCLFPVVGRYFDFLAAKICDIDTSNKTIELVLVEQLTDAIGAGSRYRVRYDFPSPNLIFTSCSRPPDGEARRAA